MERKLFVAAVLSIITLQSCHDEDVLIQESTVSIEKNMNIAYRGSESNMISEYVQKQLSVQYEIKEIVEKEKNINFPLLQSKMGRVSTIEELEALYKEAGIHNIKELIERYERLKRNTIDFQQTHSDFFLQYNEEKRRELLISEMDRQLGNLGNNGLLARNDCHAGFVRASKMCMRNYGIEVVGSAAVGAFTGGVGGVIAGSIATAHMVACNSDAERDYHICVKEGGKP
ncbi:hypothetical protein D1632_16810 [Chryseobacterium nematophagum]|uniref:Uncharacterized protein n=1 Tax=Chryseobacterium nematophagum TaxID=2305228 RepID=A0A3M7L930_9FLAO|nr:hypothetical protein [Chryseobacterium nematophagum]RMZ57966.1 hypothetical protein D1632_16810 [Chryseobacterium nematophagum]